MKAIIPFLLLFLLPATLKAQSGGTYIGAIDGVFDVSDLGGATYTIPLKIPDGRAGLQPSLALVYNSQGGNGIMGMGWSLSGLSAITRAPNTIYLDNRVQGVSLDAGDRFALDGNVLMITSAGNYGAPNTTYCTQVETFREIKAFGALGTGPQYFTVTDQDGKVYEYGAVANARATVPGKTEPYMWLLNKVTDLSGNYMTYEYYNTSGEEPLMHIISYNANQNTGMTPRSSIYFYYENRPDPNFHYIGGGKMTSTKRMKEILVMQIDEYGFPLTYRDYYLEYTVDFYTHLIKVREHGKDAALELQPTEFTYGTSNVQNTVTQVTPNQLIDGEYVTGDYNGDGLMDFVRIPLLTANINGNIVPIEGYLSNNWELYLNTGTSFQLTLSGTAPPYSGGGTSTFRILRPGDPVYQSGKSINSFDYDGDGRDELLMYRVDDNGSSSNALYLSIFKFSNNGTTVSHLFNPAPLLGKLPFVGDFDGDGRSEILLLNTNKNTLGQGNVMIGHLYGSPMPASGVDNITANSPFTLNGLTFDAAYFPDDALINILDYNGDGKADILCTWQVFGDVYTLDVTFDGNHNPVVNPTTAFESVYRNILFPTVDHRIFPGDFNGDGMADLLTWRYGSGWQIGYGKGDGAFNDIQNFTGFLTNVDPYDTNTSVYFRPGVFVGDFNGDGKSDVYQSFMSSGGFMNYSKGNNNFELAGISFSASTNPINGRHYTPMDVNGDGATDFLLHNANRPIEILVLRAHETRHLVHKVKNGMGVFTDINYWTLVNNTSLYTPGATSYTYPFISKALPLKAVSSIKVDNGINTTGNDITYSYSGLKYHVHGKGLLGFDNVSRIDHVNDNLNIVKTFSLNTTYVFPYLEKTESIQGSYVLNRTYSTYAVHHFGSKIIFPYLDMTEKSDFVSNQFSREEYKYTADAGAQPHGYTFGKPNSVIIRNGYTIGSAPVAPVQLDLTEQEFKYPDLPNSLPIYLRTKPYSIITTNTRQGQSAYSRRTDYTYYTVNGLPHTIISDPSTGNQLTTTLSYNAYGNLTGSIKSASGWAARTEAFTYDPSLRYVTESWNTAYPNVKSTTIYDLVLGLPSMVVQPDGFTAEYYYDPFGLPEYIYNNNGLYTATFKDWSMSHSYAPTNAKYYIQTLSNDPSLANYKFYDRLGRLLRTAYKGFDGTMIFEDQTYNIKGQLSSSTKPYFQGNTPQTTTYTYDIRGRLTQEAAPEGTSTLSYLITGTGSYYEIAATNAAGQVKKTSTDKSGKTVITEDHGGTLTYTYHSNGQVQQTTLSGAGVVLTKEYDAFGRMTKETDPNYGSYEYTYNPHGEMYLKKDPKGQNFYFSYNQGGYMFQWGGPQGIFDQYYHYGSGSNCGKLIQVNRQGGGGTLRINYDHGIGGKLNYEERIAGIEAFKTEYTYDGIGRTASKTFPNGKKILFEYKSTDGSLYAISHYAVPIEKMLYIDKKNAFGQNTSHILGLFMNVGGPVTGGPKAAWITESYSPLGLLTEQKSEDENFVVQQDLFYQFDPATGNLDFRRNYMNSLVENFSYDLNNRLTGTSISHLVYPWLPVPAPTTVGYSANGNILNKTDAGIFSYDQANRVSEITSYVDIPEEQQTLSYTAFNKVAEIQEDGNAAVFQYWPDETRRQMTLSSGGVDQKIKYYAPDYEKEVDPVSGTARELCYVNGPDGRLVAIIETIGGVNKTYYVLTDHLGSITHLLDDYGVVLQERSYDAWGRRRDPSTLEVNSPVAASDGWDRGYTGHEHLPQFGIINMNGRLYDPVMGRMFSPDPYIMGEDNTQGYNRYTYALNNPLSYTDPSGEIVNFIGAAVLSGFVNWYTNGAEFSWKGLGYFGIGALAGGAGYGVAAGASSLLSGSLGMVGGGVISGASSGFSAGFLSGYGNGLLNGVSSPLGNGLKSGIYSGLAGGVIGGVVGLYNRMNLPDNDIYLLNDYNSGEYFASNEELKQYVNDNIGDISFIEKKLKTSIRLGDRSNLPAGYSLRDNFLYNSTEGYFSGGITIAKGGFFTPLRSTILISPGIKGLYYAGVNITSMNINHELIHAWHLSVNMKNYNMYTERITSDYSYRYAIKHNMMGLSNTYKHALGPYPSSYGWRVFKLLNPFINLGL